MRGQIRTGAIAAAIAVVGMAVAACASAPAPAPAAPAAAKPPAVTTSLAPPIQLFSTAPSPPPSPRSLATIPPSKTTKSWGTPIFVDNFSESHLSSADWNVYDSPDATPPRSVAAVTLAGGLLNITGGFNALGKDESGGIGSKLDQMYGRWEVRFRVDRGPGYSAVALLWPEHDNDWPQAGEIDFTEVNRGARTTDNLTVHKFAGNDVRSGAMHADFTKWHTIAVEWLPGHVSFYLDGVRQSFLVTAHSRMVPDAEPMHLALQFDQGCDDWFQCRDATTPPKVVMQVDWVKIFAPPLS